MPVLGILRDVYLLPRDQQRFQRYLATLTGGGDDVVLPIGVANPMAREQAVVKLDELLAQDAEEIGAAAAVAAAARLERPLAGLDVHVKASLVLVDDVGGGWTNRYTTEASVRFPGRGALRRPFATGLVWTSESPTAADLRQELMGAIYRVVYQQRRGLPVPLDAMLQQEGLALRFAEAALEMTLDQLDAARAVLARLGNEPAYPAAFAFLYGDDAALQLGYRPLGVPPRAGFAVALANARDRDSDPVAALADDR